MQFSVSGLHIPHLYERYTHYVRRFKGLEEICGGFVKGTQISDRVFAPSFSVNGACRRG